MSPWLSPEILDYFFQVEDHRVRSLSDIMNRGNLNSLPIRFSRSLEEHFHPDSFRAAMVWFYNNLNPSVSPFAVYAAINAAEDKFFATDPMLEPIIPFFLAMR